MDYFDKGVFNYACEDEGVIFQLTDNIKARMVRVGETLAKIGFEDNLGNSIPIPNGVKVKEINNIRTLLEECPIIQDSYIIEYNKNYSCEMNGVVVFKLGTCRLHSVYVKEDVQVTYII